MVTHVLKDGTILKSIEGHKVKKADAPMLYEYLKERRIKSESTNVRRTKKAEK